MHILFCVNNIKFGTKCFVKVEQFVLPFIKVLGTGCAGCRALYETTKQAITELGCDVVLIKEEDLLKIMEYNVLSLPALVVDGKVVSAGKRLSLAEVKELIPQ